jgi:hypothetical protein
MDAELLHPLGQGLLFIEADAEWCHEPILAQIGDRREAEFAQRPSRFSEISIVSPGQVE